MPQYYYAILALFVLRRLDRTDDKLNHAIHFRTRTDVNRPVLMKLWLDVFRCSDGTYLT